MLFRGLARWNAPLENIKKQRNKEIDMLEATMQAFIE